MTTHSRPLLYMLAACIAFWLWVGSCFGATGNTYTVEGLTPQQEFDLARVIALFEKAIYPMTDRSLVEYPDAPRTTLNISFVSAPLPEGAIASTQIVLWSFTSYDNGYAVPISGPIITIGQQYTLDREQFSIVVAHELAHVYGWNDAYWWISAKYAGREAQVVDGWYIETDTPFQVDDNGHRLGDDLHLMDTDLDRGAYIDMDFWQVIENAGWNIDWNKVKTGELYKIIPRRPRGPIIITVEDK
jgi:hypothetical protein